MKLILELSHDEVCERIPYQLVCETMCGSRWNTGKRKKLMKERFTEKEIDKIYKMKSQAYSWTLTKGVPLEGVKMSINTLGLWEKLAAFCMEL